MPIRSTPPTDNKVQPPSTQTTDANKANKITKPHHKKIKLPDDKADLPHKKIKQRTVEKSVLEQKDTPNNLKKSIFDDCKMVYQEAVLAKSYKEFSETASSGVEKITEKMSELNLSLHDRFWRNVLPHTLKPTHLEPTVKRKKQLIPLNSSHYTDIEYYLSVFLKSDSNLSVQLYGDPVGYHSGLCVFRRKKSDNKNIIKVTLIDSVGITYSKKQKRYTGYINEWAACIFDVAEQNSDISFELGLLQVNSQNDTMHCNAWLAEFIRKTNSFSKLDDELWKESKSIDTNIMIDLFPTKKREYIPDNLKLNFLTKLPANYMMAVQNPDTIRKYIETFKGSTPNIEKLEKLLNKEVYPDYKLDNGRLVETNVHLERKSLKYILECVVEELKLPIQELEEFKQFLKENSPYYDE
ncbi:hypothetical protein [uncultured Endozoicomonas sp.]|uniref:hypothetical protein n=1 Tax=uncultured Endozoicomonas sp. TaxID=432652 RepID=UPI00261D1BA5|nr:hypothetical protein [uncultured Endozoicomonas sp.]